MVPWQQLLGLWRPVLRLADEGTRAVPVVLSSPSSDYLVRSYLGEGTFGKVAKCLKMATRETVAVKIIKHKKFSPEAQNEVEILQQLRAFDPDRYNIVKFIDAFVDKGNVCLEFEMLDVSLQDFLEKKPANSLTVKEIRPILHQVAITLQFLKSQGVVHTDLKPDNIMLVDHVNQPMKVKVIDFGLACQVSPKECGTYMQPRFYRAPEVILGSTFTAAIDMWSLGCITAELFLGHVLYPGRCEYDMLRQMVQTQGQLPRQVLNNGVKTRCFFKQKKKGRRWRLKTPLEYGDTSYYETRFYSLDDLKKVRPACHLSDEDTMAETEDQDIFVDLLKQMLQLDMNKRITPDQLLEDPFITMGDLVDNFPDSFYVKSGCEMMKVCQSLEDQAVQQSFVDQQPSTSTASLHQHNISRPVTPAWRSLSHQEHPVILSIALAVSSTLSIDEDRQPSQPRQTSFTVYKDTTQLEQKTLIDSEDAPSNTDLLETPKEAPDKAKPPRKRTWDTFVASNCGLRKLDKSSPEKKRMKVNLLRELKNPSSEAEVKPQRKRSWDTFVASYTGLRNLKRDSPEKKKMKMNEDETNTDLLENPKEAPDKAKPPRKRTWDTFVASNCGLRKLDKSSPEKKRMKVNLLRELKNPSSEAEVKPQRKRSWDTFVASYTGLRNLKRDSPEKKKMKMNEDETNTETLDISQQVTCSKVKPSESDDRSHPGENRSSDETPMTAAKTRSTLRRRKAPDKDC
ncbi:homeodomain-interacting protein kinase 1-like [Labrus bergylta]|uniref:homeodomain-interacting protein kinase 1-like n=1 Tax=Labrus bergylta TaxID=56723 RepID=UPI0033140FDA